MDITLLTSYLRKSKNQKMANKKTSKKVKQVRTETRYKSRQELIQEAIAWMEWGQVRRVMEFLKWTWDDNGVPEEDDLKQKAFELLNSAYDEAQERIDVGSSEGDGYVDSEVSHCSGGLCATISIEYGEVYDVSISFILESSSAEAVQVLQYS